MYAITLTGQLFPLKLNDIISHITITGGIVTEWHSLGIHLKMSSPVLEEIKANNPNNVVASRDQMISKWISGDSMKTPSCWWSLVKAVRGMGKNGIAKNIEDNHGKFD